MGFDQGFDFSIVRFRNRLAGAGWGAGFALGSAVAFGKSRQPVFTFVHLFSMHKPYPVRL